MREVIGKKLILGVLFSLFFSFNVQAQEVGVNSNTKSGNDTILLPIGQRESSDRQNGYARGDVISSAFASITNLGDGKIEILLETLAHHQCDRIRQVAYLERWVAEDQDYEQVARYEFVESAEDHPNESFTALTSVVVVDDQPSGYYYRVRGAHNVYANGGSEGFNTRTDGVMITK